ncbi:MAG TPA: hypothetical protein VMJ11_17960 [Paraburkholderia sp.]|uniref:hypothetical protein n=1 Tax=Paraburkholderia sp. TaxID=1926495 RepID=UPI002C0908E0|nr:hypothetical protein [Paraburkholderia sp.]HTR08498.1 hypothetical protein [Paraburkholderia sp.]
MGPQLVVDFIANQPYELGERALRHVCRENGLLTKRAYRTQGQTMALIAGTSPFLPPLTAYFMLSYQQ